MPTTKVPPTKRAAAISIRAVFSRVLAAVFVGALFVPVVGAWRHWDPGGEFQENRELSPRPEIPINYSDFAIYTDQWLDFYRDRFGFRNTLIRAAAITSLRSFNADIDGRVLFGKEGWLYYRPDGDPNFLAFRGLNPLSESQLDAWQQLLERRNAWLKARGIAFLVVIPPDKQTIYPEFLPDSASILVRRSHLDQIIDRLQRIHSPVFMLDLRPALLAAKSSARLYYKTDTHWNGLGAYIAYRAIINSLNQIPFKWTFTAQPRSDFITESSHLLRGDLARIIHMSKQYSETSFTLKRIAPFFIPPDAGKLGGTIVTETNDPKLPRLYFVRDSFADALIPMLGPHFSHALYSFHVEMDPILIEHEKPDLVIDEFVERSLYQDPPTDPGPPSSIVRP